MGNELKKDKIFMEGIRKLGIDEDDIILSSPVDLSFDAGYICGYVFVTASIVGVCTGSIPEGYVNCFKGIDTSDLEVLDPTDVETELYDIFGLARLRLDTYIGSNVLSGEYNGSPVHIAAFSNRYQQEMTVLYRKLRTFIKEGKMPSDEVGEDAPEQSDEGTGKKSKRNIFLRTLRYFLRYKLQIIVLFLTYVSSAAVSIAWPYLTGTILFDRILARDDVFLMRFGLAGKYTVALTLVALMMIGVRFLQAASNYMQIFVMAKVASSTVRDIKTDVFDSMSRLSLNFFVNKQTGGLMTRVLSDSERVREFFIDGLPMIFVHGGTIIVTFIVMYRLNWKMALLACILLPLLVFITVKLRPGLWTLSGKRHRAEKAVNVKANANLTGAGV